MNKGNTCGSARPGAPALILGPGPALPTMVPQLQLPAAPIHTDPVQALGITLHKLAKKIHYALGGGGEGGWCWGKLWDRQGVAWLDLSTTAAIKQLSSPENLSGSDTPPLPHFKICSSWLS